MTSFDGLLEARSRQISDIVRRSGSRLIPGEDRATRETTTGEKLLALVGAPEEIITKAIGNLYSDNKKYDWSTGVGGYNTQTSFGDLFRDTGMPPEMAAVLGIAAAIANPLDPVNKLNIGKYTKLGKAAEAVATAGDNLIKGSDDLWRISVKGIEKEIAAKEAALKAGELVGDNALNATASIRRGKEAINHAEELNSLLLEVQARGVDLKNLKLAGSFHERVAAGQQHILGFSAPNQLDQLSLFGLGRNPKADMSIFGLGGKKMASLVKAISGAKNKMVKPISDAAYKMADYIGIPTIRTDLQKKLFSQVKKVLDEGKADVIREETNLESLYSQFLDSYGPEGREAAKNDLLAMLQTLELRHTGVKEMAIDVLSKMPNATTDIPKGKGVVVEPGPGLSDEQKLRLTQSGIADEEIPVAIDAFEKANVPGIRVGKNKEHEAKVIGKYVVVKTTDPKVALSELNELDGIYGNRVWAKHQGQDGASYIAQKRHPSARRITKTDDFQPEHLRNLEVIAAQLSHKKKGFTALKPEDILVSPSGAVQIINPSVITEYKSAKQAVANSRQALDTLADVFSFPRGSAREMPSLKNTVTARNVPKGVSGMSFRVARGIGASEDIVYMPAHDLLEQAVNTAGHRDIVRASYDQISPVQLAEIINGAPTFAKAADIPDFERANNIEFHRKAIRQAVAEGRDAVIDPIILVQDDVKNLHIKNGRDRLTAAILEGYEAVPVRVVNFIGDVADVEKGFYVGSTLRLVDTWNSSKVSSATHLSEITRGIISQDYSIVNRNGDIVKPTIEQLAVSPDIAKLFNRMITSGPQFNAGKARNTRIESVVSLLNLNFGNVRNAMLRLAEVAEASPDLKTFVSSVEAMLTNPKTGKGIVLDNLLRHPHAESMLMQLKSISTVSLDTLASNGVFTTTTVKDARRLMVATDSDVIIQVIDRQSNTLRLFSNQTTTAHLKTVANNFLNSVGQADDIEPYARIELYGAEGTEKLEVKDFVTGQHPRIADMVEPVKVFKISDEHRDVLKKEGILVADGKNTDDVVSSLKEKGLDFGVLLKEVDQPLRSTKTNRYLKGTADKVIVRPEFTFFVTRSGALVIGTKQKNVKDLLETIFEEGPAYFEEFGVMTTGRILISNPFGSKMAKIGVGEIKQLQDRITTLANRFKELGFGDGTLMTVKVPFDDAVWRSMYGERVTIGEILDDSFEIKIPDNLRGYVPDTRILSPGRVGGEATELGIVGLEKTRLANEKLQTLMNAIVDIGDKLFLERAKAGLPVSYYTSWFARNLTTKMKEALSEIHLKYPDKESKTFKNAETFFKNRTIADLTTQEFNEIIKRLKKEGVENPESIISDVVFKYRDDYVLKPSEHTAGVMAALAKITPEGIDFFHTDPIWATALSVRDTARAITRKQIVDSIENLGIAAWSGSIKELEEIKLGKNKKFIELENEIKKTSSELTETQAKLDELKKLTPDMQTSKQVTEFSNKVTELTNKLDMAVASKSKYLEKIGTGKILETVVDLESEHMWIRGEDLTKLIDDGVIKASDVSGDVTDAFVRIPVKKYASTLDPENSKVFLFPKEVEPVIRRFFQTTTREGFGKFLQYWDTIHQIWRNWTLLPIPSYHIRNGISSAFQAHLGGVTDARSYAESFNILGIVEKYRQGSFTKRQVQEALASISFATAQGKVISGQEIYDNFLNLGGFAGGQHFNEFNAFGDMTRASTFERLSIKAGLRPSSDLAGSMLTDNAALRLGVTAAAFVENRFRLAAFIDSLAKGHTEIKNGIVLTGFEAAAMNMKRIFYDYSDLSAFERSFLRRVIPFYSWSRHNIPRMLETLITNPVVHYRLGEFFHEVEVGATGGSPIGENDLPQWVRDRFGLVTDKTKEGKYVVKVGDGFIPMIDAYKMIAGGSLVKMVKDGLTPFIKLPIEQLTNYSLYTEREIEKYPGQVSSSFTLANAGFSKRATAEGPLGVLNILLNENMFRTFFRPGGELVSKIIDPIFDGKEGPSFKLGVYGLFLGKAYEIDPQQARMAIYQNWSSRQKQIISLHNQAVEQGDIAAAEGASNMLSWLRLQYPGDKEL